MKNLHLLEYTIEDARSASGSAQVVWFEPSGNSLHYRKIKNDILYSKAGNLDHFQPVLNSKIYST